MVSGSGIKDGCSCGCGSNGGGSDGCSWSGGSDADGEFSCFPRDNFLPH